VVVGTIDNVSPYALYWNGADLFLSTGTPNLNQCSGGACNGWSTLYYQSQGLGKITGGAGSAAPTSVTSLFTQISGIAVDAAGNWIISDFGGSAVLKVPSGSSATTNAMRLATAFTWGNPRGVAVNLANHNIYVLNGQNIGGKWLTLITGANTGSGTATGIGDYFCEGGMSSSLTIDGSGKLFGIGGGGSNGGSYVWTFPVGATACTPIGGTSTNGNTGYWINGGISVVSGYVFFAARSSPNGGGVFMIAPGAGAGGMGTSITQIVSGGGGFNNPVSLAVKSTGGIYVGIAFNGVTFVYYYESSAFPPRG
jgi:hypothetical protein